LEYARNVLGLADANHKEANPESPVPFISPLSCSLIGEKQTVSITRDTTAHKIYEKEMVAEQFNCSYGLNEAYRGLLQDGDLKIAGVDHQHEVRIVELAGHRFFIATLYMPQLSSTPANPHPLIVSFLNVAESFYATR
jgi:CTP synthase (UTP-ammonia lyase)